MHELDEFFKQRDERLAKEKAARESQQKADEDRASGQQKDKALLQEKGPQAYLALQAEIRSLADEYHERGFENTQDGIRFGSARIGYGSFVHPVVNFHSTGLGAIAKNLQVLELQPVIEDEEIKWRVKNSRKPTVYDTPGLANLAIKQLIEASDTISAF